MEQAIMAHLKSTAPSAQKAVVLAGPAAAPSPGGTAQVHAARARATEQFFTAAATVALLRKPRGHGARAVQSLLLLAALEAHLTFPVHGVSKGRMNAPDANDCVTPRAMAQR